MDVNPNVNILLLYSLLSAFPQVKCSCFSSPTLWVHSVFSVVFLVIAVLFMRHFSAHLQYVKDEQVDRGFHTLDSHKDNTCCAEFILRDIGRKNFIYLYRRSAAEW